MNELKLNGVIKQIGEVQEFDSGFRKVEFVITTSEQFPQEVKFEVLKDKVDDFIKFNKVGATVDVSFNVRGSVWKDKHYVNLIAWKVFKSDAVAETVEEVEKVSEDDLPF